MLTRFKPTTQSVSIAVFYSEDSGRLSFKHRCFRDNLKTSLPSSGWTTSTALQTQSRRIRRVKTVARIVDESIASRVVNLKEAYLERERIGPSLSVCVSASHCCTNFLLQSSPCTLTKVHLACIIRTSHPYTVWVPAFAVGFDEAARTPDSLAGSLFCDH